MPTHSVLIVNRLGLHARAAAKFVQTAAKFPCEIGLSKTGHRVNGKSIMGLMMLAAAQGVTLELSTSGPEEDLAMRALEELIESRFGESE
ncbi:MAG: HPr family phosphocarrier protein [Gammaproteobacteria bacterium]|nr:HPr family phosphocarrier protein [Gammaproteobacteria bacterium]